MTRYIATILCVALVGCAAPTTTSRSAARSAQGRKAKPTPNLDRTYDWGARPPIANPDRERD